MKKSYFVACGNDTTDGHKVVIVTDDETVKDDPNTVRHITMYSLELAQDIAYQICLRSGAEYVELVGYC